MDALNAAGSSSAALAQWSALQGARAGDVAQDPSPEAVSELAEAGTGEQVTLEILKRTLNIDAESAKGLDDLLEGGSRVDVYA